MWWLACTLGPAATEPVVPAHYAEFGPLIDAVAVADVEAAHHIVDGFEAPWTPGSASDADALERVAAATGFLRVSDDPEDLRDGLVRLAVACGACHPGDGGPPGALHGHAVARDVVRPLVWPNARARPLAATSDAPTQALRAARGGDATETATQTLAACQGCHRR